MTEAASSASSTTAPVDTRAPSTSGSDEIKPSSRPEHTAFGSLERIGTRHTDLDHFDKDQQLARQISRQQSRSSTHTQDPVSEDFDFKQHLRHVLNKGEREGIKVSVSICTQIGRGGGRSGGRQPVFGWLPCPELSWVARPPDRSQPRPRAQARAQGASASPLVLEPLSAPKKQHIALPTPPA